MTPSLHFSLCRPLSSQHFYLLSTLGVCDGLMEKELVEPQHPAFGTHAAKFSPGKRYLGRIGCCSVNSNDPDVESSCEPLRSFNVVGGDVAAKSVTKAPECFNHVVEVAIWEYGKNWTEDLLSYYVSRWVG